MVKINEIKGLFWGVTLEGDKKYTQTPEKPVHISMAALDTTCPQADGSTASVMIEYNGSSFVLCTLQHGKLFQQPLDLEFASGETLSFYLTGKGSVHLSGYCLPDDDDNYDNSFDGDSDDASEPLSDEDLSNDSEDEDDDGSNAKSKRKLMIKGGKNAKKARMTIDDLDEDEDDSQDDDFNWDEDDSDEDEDELQDDFDEESDSDEPAKPAAKKAKQGNGSSEKAAVVNVKSKEKPGKATTPTSAPTATASQPQKSNAGSAEAEGKKKKKKKKNKNKNSGENQQQESGTKADEQKAPVASKLPTKRVADGGVVIEDLKEGHGPEARVGKLVRVYYTGRLANGKVFDSCVSGNGFKFKLGKKEVISGWDVGVSGMKVGGKRKLIIPPKMGYGSQSAGPIPANSTLVFDVELKAVN